MKQKNNSFTWFFWIFFLFIYFSSSVALAGNSVTKDEAYKLVKELMIEGKYGGYLNVPSYRDGKRKEVLKFYPSPVIEFPFKSSKINHDPRWTGYGISLKDQRGRAFFGLMGGGGWTIGGGLVDFAKTSNGTLELFGFRVLKWYNGFDNYFKYKEMIYDFYLVKRKSKGEKGEILKNWSFEYNDIIFKPLEKVVDSLGKLVEEGKISQREMEEVINDPNNRFEKIEGYLNFKPIDGKIQVMIKGLKKDFKEEVEIE